jgi:hypothetical protein
MAHYIAELIDEAEKGKTKASRSKAQKVATETILDVWKHRESLPRGAYPLAPHKDILRVLTLLRPTNNPWHYRRHEEKREELAATLFDRLSCLIIALLLDKLPSRDSSAGIDLAAIESLSEEEKYLLIAFHEWYEVFVTEAEDSKRTNESQESTFPEVNLDEAAVQLIDSLSATLAELLSEIQEGAQKPENS